MTYIIYNKSNKAIVTSLRYWFKKNPFGCPTWNIFNAKIKVKRPLKFTLKMARWYLKLNPSKLYRIKPL
jgi:hypothetical protein